MRSSSTATTPTKRPLTTLMTTTKSSVDENVTKKRKLSVSPPHQLERTDEKENWQIHEQITPSSSQGTPHSITLPTTDNTCPTPVSPVSPSPPSPLTSIPHVYAHAHHVLSTSSPFTSSLPLSGRSDQRDTLLAFLNRRFPAVYHREQPTSTATTDEGAQASTSNVTTTPVRSNPRGPGPAALYASGPPGIGKTALLSSVLGDFLGKVEERDLNKEVKVCMRNCSTVGTGETAWERLGTGLGMDWKSGKLKGKERFEQGLKDGKKYLLVLDEIDHLVSSTSTTSRTSSAPDLLNNLFSLASLPSSSLTLIGIANDLTLKALNLSSVPSPMRLLGKGKAKLDPLTTPTKPINLHFAPYSWQELVRIVSERLDLISPPSSYPVDLSNVAVTSSSSSSSTSSTKTFPLIDKVALERAAKKVATGTGDVRTILDLVRKSISIVAASLEGEGTTTTRLSDLTLTTAPKASMKHMTMAFSTSTGLTSAPSLSSRLSTLNSNHRFVLVSLVISISRLLPLGLSTTDPTTSLQYSISLEQGYKTYREVVGREENLKSVMHGSKDTFGEAVEMVQDLCGFVVVQSSWLKGAGGSSPTKGAGGSSRKTPSPSKKGKSGATSITISLSPSAPLNEIVAVLLPPTTSTTSTTNDTSSSTTTTKEDETTRLCRKMVSREMSDQEWKRKLIAMGRDENQRAEMELEGREWERKLKAQANERGEQCE